jgi:hypothetical protein
VGLDEEFLCQRLKKVVLIGDVEALNRSQTISVSRDSKPR